MNHPRITYSVSPSFRHFALVVEMNWYLIGDTYLACVGDGLSHRETPIPKEDALRLLQYVASLRLPLVTGSEGGFDGTTYELTVGSVTAASFRWWEQLPEEWQEISPIVQLLLEIFVCVRPTTSLNLQPGRSGCMLR